MEKMAEKMEKDGSRDGSLAHAVFDSEAPLLFEKH
jgi:hypothetical protein